MRYHLALMGLVLAIGGCADGARDPASESPVDPASGKYEISRGFDLGGVARATDRDKTATLCLSRAQSAHATETIAKRALFIHPACRHEQGERKGNLVTGAIYCPADPKMARGESRFAYKSVLSPEGLDIEAVLELPQDIREDALSPENVRALKLSASMLKHSAFTVTARRIGDC